MNRYSIEEYYRSPVLRDRLMQEASLARSQAIYAGFAWLVGLPGRLLRMAKKQLAPRLSSARWMARLG